MVNRRIIVNLVFQYPLALSSLGQYVTGVFATMLCWARGRGQLLPAVHSITFQVYTSKCAQVMHCYACITRADDVLHARFLTVHSLDHASGHCSERGALPFKLLVPAPYGAQTVQHDVHHVSLLLMPNLTSEHSLLQVAFMEMARSTLPLFVMLATFLAGLETPTSQLVKAVFLTAIGCGVSAYGEVRACKGSPTVRLGCACWSLRWRALP